MKNIIILMAGLLISNVALATSPYQELKFGKTVYGDTQAAAIEAALTLQAELTADFDKRGAILSEILKENSDLQSCQEILFPNSELTPVQTYLVKEAKMVYKVNFDVAFNNCY